MTGLLTGHCYLKGHLFQLELVISSEYNRCKKASKTASHILCDCEALATFKIQTLGSSFDATSRLWWHTYQQDTVVCSRFRAARCIRAAQRSSVVEVHESLMCLSFVYSIIFYSIIGVISIHCCYWHDSANYKLHLSVCFVFLEWKLKILLFCVLLTITHPMVKLTNFWICGMYMNTHGVSGAIHHNSGECALGSFPTI